MIDYVGKSDALKKRKERRREGRRGGEEREKGREDREKGGEGEGREKEKNKGREGGTEGVRLGKLWKSKTIITSNFLSNLLRIILKTKAQFGLIKPNTETCHVFSSEMCDFQSA